MLLFAAGSTLHFLLPCPKTEYPIHPGLERWGRAPQPSSQSGSLTQAPLDRPVSGPPQAIGLPPAILEHNPLPSSPAPQFDPKNQTVRPDNRLAPANPAPMTLTPGVVPVGRQLSTPNSLVPDPSELTDHVPLDWRQVQVRKDGEEWQFVQGPYAIANFGTNEADARAALAVFQYYRFTEHCLVGHPKPVFSCFLVKGAAPHGVMFGLDNVSFHPEELSVRQIGSDWVISDSHHILFHVGDHHEEASQVLKLIRQFGFDTICRADRGQPPAMTFLVKAK